MRAGDRLLTIRNIDAERNNHTKILQQQQLDAERQQAIIQQANQQQQLLQGERQAAIGRLNTIQIAIANYQRQIAPLRQQLATANVRANIVATQPAPLPLQQKREAINRARAIYEQALATSERLAQYQSQGAISQERLEQAQKELTVAKSDLSIARADYASLVAAAHVATERQTVQTQSTRLQQQLALAEQAGQLQQLQAQLQAARADARQIETKLQQLPKVLSGSRVASLPVNRKPALEPTKIDITAPIAGTAIDIPVAIGDRVFLGSKLMSITDPKKLKIGVDLDPQQAMLLKPGQRALVKVGSALNSQELVALVTNIAPPLVGATAPVENRSTQRIEVQFTNPQPTIAIGQTGTVYFPK